jgi:hypothetical protein
MIKMYNKSNAPDRCAPGDFFVMHKQEIQMMKTLLSAFTIFFITIFSIQLCGCSEQHLSFGKWKTKADHDEYVLLTAKDAQVLGEVPPAPFPDRNKQGWTRVKEMGESPEKLKSTLKPYSVVVVEDGFAFLQSTKNKSKKLTNEDLEWGWKIVIENKSKRDVWAYGGYSLFDKDGFVLADTGTDWDDEESGLLIKAGERGTVQGKVVWQIPAATKPYPPSRVVRGDYKLFLRHDIFKRIDDDIQNKKN